MDRHDFCKESKTIDMIVRLHHNMFQQEKLLLNKVDININLTHSDSESCLLRPTKKEYKVVFKEAVLLVRRVSVTATVAGGIERVSKEIEPNTWLIT